MSHTLEICAGSLSSALAGARGGANRIELCDSLSEGGTTPSWGMIKVCTSLLSIPVFPIIRPRGGDFIYSDEEFEVMKQDLICCAEMGCPGAVLGILKSDGSVDTGRCRELLKLAGAMELTFHRAFDRCNDFQKGLETIIDLGFKRVLSSGGKSNAEEAIPVLAQLVRQAGNRITVMPGAGITTSNLLKIVEGTGANEFHSTAKSKISQGSAMIGEPQFLYETDIKNVQEMREILNSA